MTSHPCVAGLYVRGKCQKVAIHSSSFQIPKCGQLRSLRSIKNVGFKFEEEKENYFCDKTTSNSKQVEVNNSENFSSNPRIIAMICEYNNNESNLIELEKLLNNNGVGELRPESLNIPENEPEVVMITNTEYNLTHDFNIHHPQDEVMNIEPEESDDICDLCGGQFSNAKGVRAHQRMIHKVQAFTEIKCALCGVSFSSMRNLNKHNCQYKFRCEQCSLPFKDEEALNHHRNWVHLGIRFNCTFYQCEASFPSKSYLDKHMETYHFSTIT